eukprot:jgi/Ulvmu1/4131/UM019_0110.1
MSVITLQIGQCGNQLGSELFEVLGKQLLNSNTSAYDVCFRSTSNGHYVPRCLLVDMEPKVVHACINGNRSQKSWAYDPANVVIQQSGSGNNWALGYNRHGSRCAEAVVECARHEVERCDHLSGFLMLQSLAGGTGAGFGSRIAEELNSHFPSALQLSYGIWSFNTGEVVVQAYNSLLSVSKLLEVCEGVILVRNEDLHRTCVNVHGQPRPDFRDLNSVAAHALASLLCPSHLRPHVPSPQLQDLRMPMHHRSSRSPPTPPPHNSAAALTCLPSQLGRRLVLADILGQVAAHPSYRLLSLRTAPQVARDSVKFTTFQWNGILKRLLQMFITRSACSERLDWSIDVGSPGVAQGFRGKCNRSAGTYICLRGLFAAQVDVSCMAAPGLYPTWLRDPLLASACTDSFHGYEMSCTLLSADQGCVDPIKVATGKAARMLHANAFVHQYQKHGVEKTHLEAAVHHAQDIVETYELM